MNNGVFHLFKEKKNSKYSLVIVEVIMYYYVPVKRSHSKIPTCKILENTSEGTKESDGLCGNPGRGYKTKDLWWSTMVP